MQRQPLQAASALVRVDPIAAACLIQAAVPVLGREIIALSQALHRVAAQALHAREALVPYARSAMDGYAVRSSDTAATTPRRPRQLQVFGRSLAGAPSSRLRRRSAMAIATGAALPRGADAVLPWEVVDASHGRISLSAPAAAGSCIFAPGQDAFAGEQLLAAGDVLTPGRLALLAFAGYTRVSVYRQPRIAVLCSGDELVAISQQPGPGQVRNSNASLLQTLLRACGCTVIAERHGPDDRRRLTEITRRLLRQADAVITTGGASVGPRDHIKPALEAAGVTFDFASIAMRPGKPMAFGRWRATPVFVLPGNPAATFVCFQRLVLPALRRMAGHREPEPPLHTASLRVPVHVKAGSSRVLLARAWFGTSGLEIVPLANQCSSLVRSAADCTALVLLPPGPDVLQPGDRVQVQVLDWGAVAGTAAS